MRRSHAGFTLIEILLAGVILACGLVVIVKGMATTMDGARHAGCVYQGASLLEEMAEQAVMDANLNGGLKPGTASGKQETSRGVFEWRLDSLPDDKDLSQVTVTVGWNEGSRPKTISSQLYLESRAEG